MIDRLREQIQERLDQLAGEADRLRKALAALDPRSSEGAGAQAARAQAGPVDAKPTATATKRAPARRPSQPAARSPRRTAPGATKAAVLAALAGGEAMTAGEVATKAGLARPTVSTTLSKLAKTGEVQKAERGYRLPAAPRRAPRRRSSTPAVVLFTPRRRRYRGRVLPLGFRFEVDAVLVGGVAHRSGLRQVCAPTLPDEAVRVAPAGFIAPSAARGSARSAGRRSRRC